MSAVVELYGGEMLVVAGNGMHREKCVVVEWCMALIVVVLGAGSGGMVMVVNEVMSTWVK